MTRPVLAALLLAAIVAAGTYVLSRASLSSDPPPELGAPSSPPPVPSASSWRGLRWLAFGGGATPESNEASLEQDVALARSVLGGDGAILFAGGADAVSVRVLHRGPSTAPTLLQELGDIFAPRAGRSSRYRRSVLPIDGPATRAVVEEALDVALRDGAAPLLLYLVGHGEKGETPRDATLALWGEGALSAADLARLLDRSDSSRSVRVIGTTCFGGGFAEIVFVDAAPERGIPPTVRCGLFATTAEQPAAGCDPNPDRDSQESYALHFWNALAGRDRDGHRLPLSSIDFDGDGAVSLLEAHARARIADSAADVPTNTSDRWLRARAPRTGPTAPVHLPEEDAVIAALAERTGLAADPVAIARRLAALASELEEALARLEEAREEEDEAYAALAAELLARWPVLDDPWHPEFAATLERDTEVIRRFLDSAVSYDTYRLAADATVTVEDAYWEVRRRMAPLERLQRALETRELAGRLERRGGADWLAYQRLLACERGRP